MATEDAGQSIRSQPFAHGPLLHSLRYPSIIRHSHAPHHIPDPSVAFQLIRGAELTDWVSRTALPPPSPIASLPRNSTQHPGSICGRSAK
jgi:hypothetical protein